MRHERLCQTGAETCDFCHTAKSEWRCWQMEIGADGGGSGGFSVLVCDGCHKAAWPSGGAPEVKTVIVLE